MDRNPNSAIRAPDRKTVEKNRRDQMKALFSILTSLVPKSPSREAVSLQDQVEEATNYIRNLQANVEKMRKKKNRLTAAAAADSSSRRLPIVDVGVTETVVKVVLVTELHRRHHLVFVEALRILHEEGAEVVSAYYSVVNEVVFHTIHSKIGDQSGQETYGSAARISERLQKFVSDSNID